MVTPWLWQVPRWVTVLAVSLLLAALLVVAGPATPAQAACGDVEFSKVYNGVVVSSYNMATASPKQGVGCYDGNVRQSSASTTHRGQWLSDGGTWYWSTAGSVWITAGTQSPAKVLIAGPISVGRWLRIGTINYGGTGIWWF